LAIDGALTTTDPVGQILLQSDTSISQAAGSVVATNELLVGSSTLAEFRASSVDLQGDNLVNNLAVGLDNSFNMVNDIDLKVSSISFSSVCGTTESQVGIDVVGGDPTTMLMSLQYPMAVQCISQPQVI